ncbi:MAG: hypothetical protein JWN81_1279, partial [Solirubrobacterales bacterium]|nr:hypothetical protein [Solirubrobacterales bacterium]
GQIGGSGAQLELEVAAVDRVDLCELAADFGVRGRARGRLERGGDRMSRRYRAALL